jgi:hypothetical protein
MVAKGSGGQEIGRQIAGTVPERRPSTSVSIARSPAFSIIDHVMEESGTLIRLIQPAAPSRRWLM